jgi:hypothetical protein
LSQKGINRQGAESVKREEKRLDGSVSFLPLALLASWRLIAFWDRGLLAMADSCSHAAFLPADLATSFPFLHGFDIPSETGSDPLDSNRRATEITIRLLRDCINQCTRAMG